MAGPEGSTVTEELAGPLRSLLDRFRAGRRVGLARAISLVEDERPGFQDFLHRVLAGGLEAVRVGLGPRGRASRACWRPWPRRTGSGTRRWGWWRWTPRRPTRGARCWATASA